MRDSSVTAARLGIVIPRRADGKLTRAWSSEDVEDALDDREQAASQLAENREQVRRMTRNPSVLRNSVSEDAEPLLKELLIAGMAHEKAVEDWRPYCEPGADEACLYLGAREESASSPLGKDDPDTHVRMLHAELFLLSAEKLEESLRAFVAETSLDWENLPWDMRPK